MNRASNSDRSFVDRENSFAFVSINNNKNTIIEEETPVPPVEECTEAVDDIKACFEEFLDGEGEFLAFVAALETGINAEINGRVIAFRSFENICETFEGLTINAQLEESVSIILNEVPDIRLEKISSR